MKQNNPIPAPYKDVLNMILHYLDNKQIKYQITGGLAARAYGSFRSLYDIDIDVSLPALAIIAKDFSDKITFGPGRYQDNKWQMDMLTLELYGISIDFTAVENTLIFDDKIGTWISCDFKLDTAQKLALDDLKVYVTDKRSLQWYKVILQRPEDLLDIQNIQATQP